MRTYKLGIILLTSAILTGVSAPAIQAAAESNSASTQQASSNPTALSVNDNENIVYTTEGQDGPTTQSSTDSNGSVGVSSSNYQTFNQATDYATPDGIVSGDQLNNTLMSGSAIVGKHTYTISKKTLNTIKDLSVLVAAGILSKRYPALATLAIPIAEYAINHYKIGHNLKVHVWDLKNTSGGVSTVVKSYTWSKA